jgi:hypothetical protein
MPFTCHKYIDAQTKSIASYNQVRHGMPATGSCAQAEVALGQSQWDFIKVSWTLNMLMWHRINEERDDKSFMGAERVSWG